MSKRSSKTGTCITREVCIDIVQSRDAKKIGRSRISQSVKKTYRTGVSPTCSVFVGCAPRPRMVEDPQSTKQPAHCLQTTRPDCSLGARPDFLRVVRVTGGSRVTGGCTAGLRLGLGRLSFSVFYTVRLDTPTCRLSTAIPCPPGNLPGHRRHLQQ